MSVKPLNMINLSVGNIPSFEANSIQTMKLSNAFAKIVNAFELVTFGDIFHALHIKKFNIFSLYDVEKFHVTVLPLKLWYNYTNRNFYRDNRFNSFAPIYCSLKRKSHIVYTRKPLFMVECLKRGMKTVLEYHHDLQNKYFTNNYIKSDNFLGIIVISDILKNKLVCKGIDENKIMVLQSGVDFDRFQRAKYSRDQARSLLKLPLNKKIIVYSGHLYDFKGIPLLIELACKMSDLYFVLIGGFENDIEKWNNKIKHLGLKNIFLAGFKSQKEVPVYLKAADILILPNSGKHDWSETTSPLKLFEYMASGRPVVASKLLNIQNIIMHEKNGLLAQPDDPISFKMNIEKLLRHENLGHSVSQEALKTSKKYSWDIRAQKIISFLMTHL